MGDGHALFQIDNGEIGIITQGNAALAGHAEQTRRTGTGQIDKAFQRQPSGMDVIEHQGHQRLHAGHARRRGRIGLGLFFQRMRRMIGAEHVGHALLDAPPQRIAMAQIAHRRVHLRQRAQFVIAIRRHHGQVMRGNLAARHVFLVGQIADFRLGRNVQHMHARAGFARQSHQTFGAAQGHFLAAPDRMGGRIALDPQIAPLAQHHFILGMEGRTAAQFGQDFFDPAIILDQQRAGGRAHEHLDTR